MINNCTWIKAKKLTAHCLTASYLQVLDQFCWVAFWCCSHQLAVLEEFVQVEVLWRNKTGHQCSWKQRPSFVHRKSERIKLYLRIYRWCYVGPHFKQCLGVFHPLDISLRPFEEQIIEKTESIKYLQTFHIPSKLQKPSGLKTEGSTFALTSWAWQWQSWAERFHGYNLTFLVSWQRYPAGKVAATGNWNSNDCILPSLSKGIQE